MNLRQASREIFDYALRSVDAREATVQALNLERSSLRIHESNLDISDREVYIVSIGKASLAMAKGAIDVLGDRVTGGLITAHTHPSMGSLDPDRWQTFRGGHPLPTQQSLDAAQATIHLLQCANERRALVIFLISGGGSAMLEFPRGEEISLSDLRDANRQLISCGASISEINSVRRAFSAIKGGRLAALAPLADQVTLIVSDTNPGDETSVASGPTLRTLDKSPDPMKVVDRYHLNSSLPPSVLRVIRDAKSDEPERVTGKRRHFVVLDNKTAVGAAAEKARQLGFLVEIADDVNEQEIGEGCRLLESRLRELWKRRGENHTVCLISGGEFSCPVRGPGIGGRNQETALRCAIAFDKSQPEELNPLHFIAFSGGTDGLDGNSEAAGAIADETTVARALSRGLDAESYLRNSDSFSLFKTLGDAVVTGSTGTNVRDLRILLAQS